MEYCSLASGSSGNCHYIKTEQVSLLVDVGLSAKYIKDALNQVGSSMEEIQAVFISHDHSDHIKGLATLVKKFDFDLYIDRGIYESIKERLSIADSRLFFIDEMSFLYKDVLVEIFDISHDATRTFGFSFSQDDKRLSVLTDVGAITQEVYDAICESDFLVIESNHDEHLVENSRYPYHLKKRILSEWGHLSNRDCGELIANVFLDKKRLKFALLAHLSDENNYPELALLSVKQELSRRGIEMGKDLLVEVAHRKEITNVYRIL